MVILTITVFSFREGNSKEQVLIIIVFILGEKIDDCHTNKYIGIISDNSQQIRLYFI
jgi:hypothetical protein